MSHVGRSCYLHHQRNNTTTCKSNNVLRSCTKVFLLVLISLREFHIEITVLELSNIPTNLHAAANGQL